MIFKCPTVEFEIIAQIAKGGMGTIYKAIQKGAEGFEKIVAIKVLNPDLASDESFREMFVSEAKLVANLVHENIVQVYQLERSKG
ncbi:MAG: protein kinase, partial [Kiritimatiellaeota bacterium]|nr:protein kinase [Kiritimatiellota bacterium]